MLDPLVGEPHKVQLLAGAQAKKLMHSLPPFFFIASVRCVCCPSLPHCDIRLSLLAVSNVSAPIARSDSALKGKTDRGLGNLMIILPSKSYLQSLDASDFEISFFPVDFWTRWSNQFWLRFWTWLWFDYWNQLNVINRDDLAICEKGNACLVMICSKIASRLTFWILKLFMPVK